MKQINFQYPFMIFQKCQCTQQIPIKKMNVAAINDTVKVSWDVTCTCCGRQLHKFYEVSGNDTTDLSQDIHAYKIVPSIKDEIAIAKLETFKAKRKNNSISFYGNYSHLRFFDNVIEDDIIPVNYVDITQPFALLMAQ